VAKILLGIHDDLKDKPMTLELGWVRDASGGKYETVGKAKVAAAEATARALIQAEEDAEDEDEDME